uniref:Uncharacterized protein n=1 Tax=Arabidopsis thaliana TaxID=3702 RepID=Q56YK4_ARATH|nr:hypothetical protein [Arabidopsis thaliana]
MDVVVFDGESKYEAAEYKGDDVIHVRICYVIRSRYTKEREEEERRHGGDRHRNGLRQPPREHPHQNTEHVPRRRRFISPEIYA